EAAPRSQEAPGFPVDGPRVRRIEVLDQVGGDDEVPASTGQLRVRGVGAQEANARLRLPSQPPLTDSYTLFREVHADRLRGSGARECEGKRPPPGAQVHDPSTVQIAAKGQHVPDAVPVEGALGVRQMPPAALEIPALLV